MLWNSEDGRHRYMVGGDCENLVVVERELWLQSLLEWDCVSDMSLISYVLMQ